MQSRVIALAVLLTMAPSAWAQAARAEGAAAEADAAMERAKRAAAGPLKAIQQASKIRRRPGEGEPAATAGAAPATTATTATTSTVLAVSTAATPSPAATAPVPPPAPAPAPAAARTEAPAVARVLEAEARVPTLPTVAGIEAQATTATAATVMPSMGVSQPLLDTLPMQPKVLSMVEPNIPARLMEQGPRVAEVEAELTLRTDGSVAAVTLMPPVPRAWQRYITTALEQWRFEPLSAARTHRVRLVFSAPN